jgi:microcin C transport system substrate-binding protein
MYGDPKYPADFKQVNYVNSEAPKQGRLRLASIGNFDNFNQFISKGVAADGLELIYDTLTNSTLDEVFSQYGLLAKGIEMPKDRGWIIFHLNPAARFSDNIPVTAADVVYTFDLLTHQGQPFYQFYYAGVEKVEALDPMRVKFSFNTTDNRELPLIIGQMPILPKHIWKNRSFNAVNLDKPIGSGPYALASFDSGKRVIYQRRADYWAKDLPINRGLYNFEQIIYEYYLDNDIALEAFKASDLDFRVENNAKLWATQYQSPAIADGRIIKESIANQRPNGMQGFIFNLRKPLFQDIVLRQAIGYALDFEWINKNLFYDQYQRSSSYFQNTQLAATSLPSKEELELLRPFKDQLPEAVFKAVYQPPRSDGSGKSRELLNEAMGLLRKAGYEIRDNQLYTPKDKPGVPKNEPVKFEFLLQTNSGFDRVVLPFSKNLQTLGISVSVRSVDVTQYVERQRNFDFDMIVHTIGQSLSPGNEQRSYWSSAAAKTPDSRNLIGISNPVVDALVEQLIQAPDQEALTNRARALDRVLQWNYYLVPNWSISSWRVAYWKRLQRPTVTPPYDLGVMAWWDSSPTDPLQPTAK